MSPGTRLLLVDDEDNVRVTLAALLEDEVDMVDEADGVESAAEAIAANGRYDFIVLDLQLGERSGLELLPAIDTHQPAALVVLLSGDLGVLSPQETARVSATVAKGARFEELLGALGLL